MHNPAAKKSDAWIWVICLASVAALGVIGSFLPGPSDRKSPPDPGPPVANKVGIGEKGVLRTDGPGGILVAIDDPTWDAMNQALAAQDKVGLLRLSDAGKIFVAPQGTPALVIDIGTFSRKVRILDGPHRDEAGWVAVEFVRWE